MTQSKAIMNFRFAHYDPPKQKPPKQPAAASTNTSVRPKSKVQVVQRTRKVAHHRREKERQTATQTPLTLTPDDDDVEDEETRTPPGLRRSGTGNSTLTASSSNPLCRISSTSTLANSTSDDPEPKTVVWRYLSQGRIDPFRVYPVDDVPDYVDLILDHAVNKKWARVSPSDEGATRSGWMQCALSNPVVFYALSFAASQHFNYLNQGHDPNTAAPLVRLSYKTEAVKLINQQLAALNGKPIPDALLIAILSLGAHGNKTVKPSGPAIQSPLTEKLRGPKSPLASAQMIDFYGRVNQETAHMSALRTILAHNKGVSNIKLPGLAGALALGDLLHSTITHQKPSLAAGTSIRHIPEVAQFLPHLDDDTFAPTVTFSLRHASSLPDNTPTIRMLNTLTLAQTVTIALQHLGFDPSPLIESNKQPVSIKSLTLARNYVHHSLLLLPEANSLWGAQFALYDVLRISALIYSDLVLFPLPTEPGVRGRYASMLRDVLGGNGSKIGRLWVEESSVLIWACLMGAVAAAEISDYVDAFSDENEDVSINAMSARRTASPYPITGEWIEERTWFVAKIRMCAEMLGIGLAKGLDSWEEVKKRVFVKYLWYENVCDVVGKGVWEEVIMLHNAMLDAGLEEVGKIDGGLKTVD